MDTKPGNEFVGEKGKGKPERYRLDYRIVARNCWYRYSSFDSSLAHDFIVVCRNLGYQISEDVEIDHKAIGAEQIISCYTGKKTETAFSVRIFGNGNVHFKINKEILLKFNIEVARLRGWIRSPKDIQSEFEVSEADATKYWQSPALKMLGQSDFLMLECKEAI
jgi:cupin superfamily acireductone dioxygenase involved in methionine salvage